jgi:hypothetical protein
MNALKTFTYQLCARMLGLALATAAFAKHFSKTGTWTYLTSSSAGAIAIQKAFESYRSDKMSRAPTTFMRTALASHGCELRALPRPINSLRNIANCPRAD